MLVDAGPLIAILDHTDRDHRACVEALRHLPQQLITTWPTFAEALYMLGRYAGWPDQDALWQFVLRGNVVLHDLDETCLQRAYELMKKYRDVPMDLADASLVTIAEMLGESRIFTLDSDFLVYRIKGRKAFDVVP